jgi:hypothetical protein
MKKILCLLTFCMSINFTQADVGLANIQAICRVTMSDGQKFEGIITFGGGGYNYSYNPNGFCFKTGNGLYVLKLLNLDFNVLEPEIFYSYFLPSRQIYYAKNISSDYPPQIPVYSYNDTNNILKMNKSVLTNFKLSEKLILYMNLPLTLYIDDSYEKLDFIDIDLSKMKTLELLKDPSEYWLKLIKTARNKLGNKILEDLKQDDGAWEDYIEPAWYHEILKDVSKYNYYKLWFNY